MNLIDFFFPDGAPDDLKAFGLVMPEAVRDSLIAVQDAAGNPRHRLSPVALTDGRWALNADVLTEARPDGLFGPVTALNPDNVALVQVLPWDDVLTLLPQPEPMEMH
jgi:hypothetical protein